MPELAVNTLRRAAVRMRADVQRILDEMDRRPDYWDPALDDTAAYSQGVDGGLGGPAGTLAASWHPGVALAVAEWLDATAAKSEELNGLLGVITQPVGDPVWDAAVQVARAYLKETDA